MKKCDYYECNDEVCADDKEIDASMHFCQKHYDELKAIIEEEVFSPKKVLSFWVRAQAERAARRVVG